MLRKFVLCLNFKDLRNFGFSHEIVFRLFIDNHKNIVKKQLH
jgi:hypothetical protein